MRRDGEPGRRRKGTRALVNILIKEDGKRRHLYSLVLSLHPNTVHKLICDHLTQHIVK
jgi:hypothetical protein